MRASSSFVILASIAVAVVSGCLGVGEDRVLSIESTGTVQGLVFFDENGSGDLDDGEPAFTGAAVGLASAGSIVAVFRTTSDADGLFGFSRVNVASYDVVVDPASIGDTVQVVATNPETFTLTPDDTVGILIAISYPPVSVEEARMLPEGEKVFVEGIALNSRGTFGDNTVHLAGAALAIRATTVRSGIILPGDSIRFPLPGDSIRFLATTDSLDGQPVLDDPTVFLLAIAEVPAPETVTSNGAATADGGRLDAALVRVESVTVNANTTVADGVQLTVDDGSGSLEVLLDQDAPIDNPAQYTPGTVIDAVGLLVPDGAGAWILKPRSSSDLTTR
jgi:hypothetical protein